MSFVKQNDLSSFLAKLENYKDTDGLAKRIADKVAEKGLEIANKEWAGYDVKIYVEETALERKIVVEDLDKENPIIGYIEFGTGIIGKGTYDIEKLPTIPITFTDKKGKEWTTQGWEYHYRYNQTGVGQPFKGKVAEMPMFNTAKLLREYIKTDLAKDLKK